MRITLRAALIFNRISDDGAPCFSQVKSHRVYTGGAAVNARHPILHTLKSNSSYDGNGLYDSASSGSIASVTARTFSIAGITVSA